MRLITRLAIATSIFLILIPSAFATNGYQLIGVGQVQKSRAGAVTASPRTPMTAISNPAGLAVIESRADFSLELFMPTRAADFTDVGGVREEGGSAAYGIPALGWSAPAFGRDDVFFGGGMYATSGLGVDYGEVLFTPGGALGLPEDITFDGYSAVQFWKVAPAIAWKASDAFQVGFALNLDYQSVTVRQRFGNVPFFVDPANPMAGIVQQTINFDLGRPSQQFGLGASLGALVNIAELGGFGDWLVAGLSYTTEQYFQAGEFRVGTGDIAGFNGALGLPGTYELDLNFPMQLAFGLAAEFADRFTISADVKWINWAATHEAVSLTGPSGSFDTDGNPANGGEADSTELAFGWEDQIVIAVGLEFWATNALALRAGFNYAPSPIDEADVFNNLVLPATVESHITAGLEYHFGDHWGLAVAYMIALENELTGAGDVPAGFQAVTPFGPDSGAKIGLEEQSLGLQVGYRF